MAIVVAIPLAFDPGGYFTFLPVKLTLVDLLVPLGIAGLILERRFTAHVAPSAAWGGLLAVVMLSAVFGIGGITSWIGYPGRSLGVIAWAIFACAFWLGTSLDESERGRTIRAAIAASIVVSVYALFQYAGVDPIQWDRDVDVTRTRSTLGNAAFLGAYLALIIPVAARMALGDPQSRRGRIVAATAALLGSAALLTTESRGALVGAVIGMLVVAALEFRRLRASTTRSVIAGGVFVAAVVLLVTVSPFASRIRSTVDPTTGTARGRIVQWGNTIDLVRERPLLGWGPDTYAFAFPRFIDAEFERTVGRDVVPDRAHNVLLDVAAAAGLLGLAAFVAVVGTIAWTVATKRERDVITVGLAGACVAYLVQLMFSFPVADLDAVLWLGAGMLIGSGGARRVAIPRAWIVLPCAVAVALGVWGASDVVADRQLRLALEAEADRDLDRALRWAERAADAPGRIQYLQAAGRLYRRVGETGGGGPDFARGLELVDEGLRIAPRDLELSVDRADLLLSWGESEGDRSLIADAATQYEKVLEADPVSSRVHLRLGVAYVQLGRTDDAETAWLTATSLAPDSPAPLINLGILYERDGRVNEAREFLGRALQLDPTNQVARDALSRLEGS